MPLSSDVCGVEEIMRMRIAAGIAVFSLAMTMWAAGPEGRNDVSLPTFRITTAEVHIAFTAAREKNRAVTDLSATDFQLLRDGRPVDDIVSFEPYADAPLSALVMVDVSDSMLLGLSLERAASQWLQANSDASRDRLSFVDFGAEVQPDKTVPESKRHLTSVYDALMETMPNFARNSGGRRSLILLTDGIDNYSLHSLNDVIAAAERYDIAVYAITAHPGKKQFYRPDILTKLCEETGGRYYEVRKADAMLYAIAQINDELRNGYEVVFRPGSAGAGVHQLAIRSTHRQLRFSYRAAYFQPAAVSDEIASVR
ncbi:MAG: VWA domain-containing protein [Terriglobales bacterium]